MKTNVLLFIITLMATVFRASTEDGFQPIEGGAQLSNHAQKEANIDSDAADNDGEASDRYGDDNGDATDNGGERNYYKGEETNFEKEKNNPQNPIDLGEKSDQFALNTASFEQASQTGNSTASKEREPSSSSRVLPNKPLPLAAVDGTTVVQPNLLPVQGSSFQSSNQNGRGQLLQNLGLLNPTEQKTFPQSPDSQAPQKSNDGSFAQPIQNSSAPQYQKAPILSKPSIQDLLNSMRQPHPVILDDASAGSSNNMVQPSGSQNLPDSSKMGFSSSNNPLQQPGLQNPSEYQKMPEQSKPSLQDLFNSIQQPGPVILNNVAPGSQDNDHRESQVSDSQKTTILPNSNSVDSGIRFSDLGGLPTTSQPINLISVQTSEYPVNEENDQKFDEDDGEDADGDSREQVHFGEKEPDADNRNSEETYHNSDENNENKEDHVDEISDDGNRNSEEAYHNFDENENKKDHVDEISEDDNRNSEETALNSDENNENIEEHIDDISDDEEPSSSQTSISIQVNKLPNRPTSMVLFYTWTVFVVFIVVLTVSVCRTRIFGLLNGRQAAGHLRQPEEGKRLLDNEYV